jgi:hypothetical protein
MNSANIDFMVFLFTLLLCYCSLLFISIPLKPRLRLRYEKPEGLLVPPVCVLTGNPATEEHLLTGFKINPYNIRKIQVMLPFSEDGWKKYCRAYPFSLKFFKAGLDVTMNIPLLGGAYLAIYLWTPLFGLFAGLIAFFELLFRKHQLVVPTQFYMNGDLIVSINISGVHEDFLEAFLKANTNMTVAEYKEYLRNERNRRIAIELGILIVIVIIGFILSWK